MSLVPRGRVLFFAGLVSLASFAAPTSAGPSSHVLEPRSTSSPLAALRGRGFWSELECAACIGGLEGLSVVYPGNPFFLESNILSTCSGACAGLAS